MSPPFSSLLRTHLIPPPLHAHTQEGSASASVVSGKEVDAAAARRVAEINSRVLSRFGSTGAMLALATAVVGPTNPVLSARR